VSLSVVVPEAENRFLCKESNTEDTLNRRDDLRQGVIGLDQRVGLDVNSVPGKYLVVRVDRTTLHHVLQINGQYPTAMAVCLRIRSRDPNALRRCDGGQPVDQGKGIQDRFVPGDGKTIDLLTVTAPVQDNVVYLAVVSKNVDRDFGPQEELRQMG